MSLFTKKPTPGGPLSVLARPQSTQPKKPAVVVTRTVVQVAPPARSRPPAKASSASAASSSSSSRPKASSSSFSSSKRKPAPKKDERPPKVRRTSVVKKVAEQRVLPESDSSSDDDDGTGPEGRDRSPQAEELVVARNVAGPSRPVPEAWEGLIAAEDIVKSLITKYKPYFKPDPDHPEPMSITLEYPTAGASETFLLLNPKSQEEYNPISEVVRIITVVLTHFLPPCEPIATPSPFPETRPTTPAASSPAPQSPMAVAPSAASSPKALTTSQPTENAQILRLLTRSIASNVLSLPLFLQAIGRYNALVSRCRGNGDIRRQIEGMPGVRPEVWSLITDQTYQRVVGPSVPVLKEYQPFSSNVYGELLPAFLSSLVGLTELAPGSVLVDLGSGVGNCCLQAALQVGCEAWGWEMMAGASRLAREQLAEAQRRWAMWGLAAGRVEIREGDFCAAPEVGEVLKRADVVICNNYAFTPELNERLSLFFLELKDGARVISLRRFVPQDFRLNERNCSSPGAIIRTEARRFPNQAVSWTHEGGMYFVQTVDRSMLQRYQKKRESQARSASGGASGSETE